MQCDPTMKAISIEGLSVRLDHAEVLSGLDLSVEKGEWLNVIGANGAGKTTLLRCILGSLTYQGVVNIAGLVQDKATQRARLVSYVPQVPVIPRGMGVVDYVLLGRTPHRGIFAADSEADLAIAAAVLHRLDLAGFAQREIQTLSGGERQRVVLARALAQQTPIILLDEPTTALDLGHQQDVLELINELRHERGLTVLATLHDLTLAARYGERIAILSSGRVAVEGSPAEVLTEETISKHFHASVRVVEDEDGPIIVPVKKIGV